MENHEVIIRSAEHSMENSERKGARQGGEVGVAPVAVSSPVGSEAQEIIRLKLEIDTLEDVLNRQVEAASKMGQQVKELETRLENSQRAVRELTTVRLTELEEGRSKRVLAEREECALTLELLAEGIPDESTTKQVLTVGAEAIRARRKP